MLKVSCKNCGINFYDINYQKRIFCSRKCHGLSKRGKPSPRLGKNLTEETKRKISLSKVGCTPWNKGKEMPQNKGENNANWIKDRTQIKIGDRTLNDPLQKQWSKRVKNRDNWKCKIADINCNGKLEAHHILSWRDYQELRYNINNGITLCHAHHPRGRAKEQLLVPKFQELISQTN